MKKKQENKIRRLLREALDLLDKKAPLVALMSKIAIATNALVTEEFESRKRQVTENMKRMGISKDRSDFELINRLSDIIIHRTMVKDIKAQIEQDRTKPK